METHEDDLEKFNFYLSGEFEFYQSILFSNLIRKPQLAELERLKSKLKKNEIECLYNHFHMSAITNSYPRQKNYVIEIWTKWRSFFNTKMLDKSISIEICDLGNEIVLYVYENTTS